MLWTILCGAVAVLAALWITYRIYNRHVLRLCRAIPCAQHCYPVIGHAYILAYSLEKSTEIFLRTLKESVLNGHRAVCFWVFDYPIVIITDPNDIRTILNNSLSRGKQIEESSNAYMKYGLLTSPVDHWKVKRRQLNLSFRPSNLEQLIPLFNSTSRRLVIDLSGHVDGTDFNLMPHVMSAALRTICIFIFGPDIMEKVSTEVFNDLRHAVELVAELLPLRAYRPWLSIDFLFNLLYRKEINSVKTSFRKMLEIADSVSFKNEGHSEDGNAKTQNSFQTILEAMRELQQKVCSVTDRHVFDELSTFFAAATDTIGTSVSSCLLALASFPHIQDKVYEEICAVMTDDEEDDITHLDLKRLTYLDRVVKETLRFFTVIPFTARALNKDIDLGGYTIPANTLTGLWVTSTCCDPKYFPEPHKFDPDRFSTPTSADDVFIPFSRGPRNCIGKHYSTMLIKLMVAHVVRKYKLSTNLDLEHLKVKYMVILTCCDGYNVSLAKRRK